MNSRQFHGVCVTPVCVENVENNLCVYLSMGSLSVARAGFFTWGIIILLKFDIPRGDFFPSKFRKFSLFMKVLKIGIFGRFLAEWKMHYLAIFLLNSIVTEMPYLPKMNLFLWTTFLSKGFKNGIIQRFWRFLNGDCMAWTYISLLPVFAKKEILWELWLWFSIMFHQRVFFLTEYEEFRNFSFDGESLIFTDHCA